MAYVGCRKWIRAILRHILVLLYVLSCNHTWWLGKPCFFYVFVHNLNPFWALVNIFLHMLIILHSSSILIVNGTICCKNTIFRRIICQILSFFVCQSPNMLQMLSKSAWAAFSKLLIYGWFCQLCSFTKRMGEVY